MASAASRGYGYRHRKLREQVAKLVVAGAATCWRCGRSIAPWEPWDLGHDDWNRSVYRGPEHRSCNRAAGARKKQGIIKINKATINGIADRW
jgi:hypothetical protein